MARVDGGAVAVADHDRGHLPGVDCDHRLVEKADATGDVAAEDEHPTQRQPGEGRQVQIIAPLSNLDRSAEISLRRLQIPRQDGLEPRQVGQISNLR
jgi:hypothetical protein